MLELEMGWRSGVAGTWAAVALVLSVPVCAGAAGPILHRLRTHPGAEATRIVVYCTERVSYDLSISERPPRVAVDLEGVRAAGAALRPRAFREGPVRAVRTVRTGRGLRLLVETRSGATVLAFPMPDPFRLIIDVTMRPRVAARAGRETAAASPTPAVPPASIRRARPAPEPAERAAAAPQPATRARRVKVVIDPGHGGKDPGARGADGAWEKDVVLAVSLRLAAQLRRAGGFDVALTRTRDVYLPLEERTARANAEHADLFVSIHANANPNPARSGMETYYLDNTDDRATMRLARMENGLAAATGRAGGDGDVAFILSDLVQRYKVEESAELAHAMQQAAVGRVRREYADLQDLGVKRGPFYVLVGAAMPSVLVEVSFITNPTEGRRLTRRRYQDALAEGLLHGLRRFAENTVHPSTL